MRPMDVPLKVQTERLGSVDALRGFNFIWILGAEGVALGLAEMMSGDNSVLSPLGDLLEAQFTHAQWEGFPFYDLVFPLFIFITGVSIVLSLPRLVEREGMYKTHWRILRRSVVLYVLGLIFYGGISEHWSDIRYVGVLQRIALCYLFASLLFLNLDWRGLAASTVALLVGYWALMTFVPVPGVGAGSYAADANLANWIDANYLPGRLWDRTRDPEGLLSTLPAIGNCLIGVLAGLLLLNPAVPPRRKSLYLVGGGIALVLGGYLWALQFPIIKAIWTSSFVLVSGGYSLLLLGTFYQIVDVWGCRRWCTVFAWVGANAIALYFLNNMMSFERVAVRFVGGDFAIWLNSVAAEGAGRLIANGLGLIFAIALAGYLYRRKVFLRA
jgi:predicted acyltransferase